MVLLTVALGAGSASAQGQMTEPLGPKAEQLNMRGNRQRQMAHCPSTVMGATTRVRDIAGGVEVTVTAQRPGAEREIRERARFHARNEAHTGSEHTGRGTGSGLYGFCPGVIEGTRVSVEDVPEGARMSVRAARPADAPAIQRVTRERAQALSAPSSSGAPTSR